MYNTIYKFRLFIQETLQDFSIHLCALKDKEPTFNDLLKRVKSMIGNRNLDDYHLKIIDTNMILCDNESFKNALKSFSLNRNHIEISLTYKKKENHSNHNNIDNHSNHNEIKSIDDLSKYSLGVKSLKKENNIPVIKPTVLRWTPAIISNQKSSRKYDSIETNEEPIKKKQRMMSTDHPRKLPDPSLSPSLRNNINFDHNLHPLEIRRPSTAPLPSSTTPPHSPFQLKLPAISSITNPTKSIQNQLAPIYPSFQKRSSVGSTQHHHNIHPSLFICEHEISIGKVCGQTFRRSYDLSRHQTIHLENRPFCYCDKCGRKFTRMDALRRHERVQGHSSSKQRSMSTSILPSKKTIV